MACPARHFSVRRRRIRRRRRSRRIKSKRDGDDGSKNSGGGAKRGRNMRGGSDRSDSKGDNKGDVDLWDEHNFGVGGEEGAEWETTKGKRMTTKREIRRRRKKKREGVGWGSLQTIQKNTKQRRRRTYTLTPNVSRG